MSHLTDRLAPSVVDLEEVVIGSCMIDKQALLIVMERLKERHFYSDELRMIFRTMRGMFKNSEAIDLVTLSIKLNGKIDAIRLTDLTGRVGSSAHIEAHCLIIIQKYALREMINMAHVVSDRAHNDDDPFEIATEAEHRIMQTFRNIATSKTTEPKDVLPKLMKQMEQSGDKNMTGVPAYFTKVDYVTGGWQDSDLILIGGRPGMGKTSFINSMMLEQARAKIPVAMLSLEMSVMQQYRRLLAMETDIAISRIRDGNLKESDWQKINEVAARLYELPLFINDSAGMNMMQIRSEAYRLKTQHDIRELVIDHVGFISRDKETQTLSANDFLGYVSRGLKNLAKELNIPIIALSQLNREVEKRANKKPQLSDLRDSGNLEQDADLVVFLYRPWYYHLQGHKGFAENSNGESTEHVGHFMLEKHRNGAVCTIKLGFEGRIAKYSDYDEG